MTKTEARQVLDAVRHCGSAQFMQHGSTLLPETLQKALREGFLTVDPEVGMLTVNGTANNLHRLEEMAESNLNTDVPEASARPMMSPHPAHDHFNI